MTAKDWLALFETRARAGVGKDIAELFTKDGFWRDYLPFGWTLQTLEGAAEIADFADRTAVETKFSDPVFEGLTEDHEGFFRFQTKDGLGRGYIKMKGGHCQTLFTMLEDLDVKPSASDTPEVLIIGGGQAGLALGAQLADLGVSYLIVDRYPRVGDQWRSRYDSLVLHDPVWYDHMPFKPFPDGWPVFTPKDQMGDWLESYADELDLNIWTSTELLEAKYDEARQIWSAEIKKDGKRQTIQTKHLVMALGLSGFPNRPTFDGQETFDGPQLHSNEFNDGAQFAGQNVVIVGANNSAHDIAMNVLSHGAKPTLIQRSSTLVVRQDDYCERLLGSLYSADAVERGITTDKADILQAATPLRLLESQHKVIWDIIKIDREAYYQRLSDAGFTVDFAEDGTGLGMKYRRTASGYYIDVGAAECVANGRIAVRSGAEISHLGKDKIHLASGESLAADAVIYATGYGNMVDWVSALIDKETANLVGPCWGYGSGTKGDPGPWTGELRNMWVETKRTGLWFTGGNLSQARFFSRLLALQLARGIGHLNDRLRGN